MPCLPKISLSVQFSSVTQSCPTPCDPMQGTLKSLLQHHSAKATILLYSAFFIVQLSHPYMTTGKTIALTRRTFFGKVMSLLFNMLSRLVITFLPRSKRLLISWLQAPFWGFEELPIISVHFSGCHPNYKWSFSYFLVQMKCSLVVSD